MKVSVENSRSSNRRGQVWRRRSCEKCGRKFTTRESVELGFLEVLKRSNQAREPYSRAKLLRSLILATDHLVSPEAAVALADTVETRLLEDLGQKDTLLSSDIASVSLEVLKRFDTRAYVKYLSYQTETLDAVDLRKKLVRGA